MRNPLDSMRIRRGLPNHRFGMVRNGGTRAHQGWDLTALIGTPIYAVADGTIEFVRINQGDYGTQICMSFAHPTEAGTTLYAFYAHLSLAGVAELTPITEGMVIGATGNSGNASGLPAIEDQHLHFEIRTELSPGRGLGGRLDPALFFTTI